MERLKGMLFGSFVGDAFSLNSHWIYDTDKLAIEIKDQKDYWDPSKNMFHSNKHIGDFTHYGDQSLLLLKSISANKGFHLETFQTHWTTFMQNYEGYMDHATTESLNFLDQKNHKGSSSDDLGGFTRGFPILYHYFDDPLLHAHLEAQTRMTHDDDQLILMGHFITDFILELIIGKSIEECLPQLLNKYPSLHSIFNRIEQNLDMDTIEFVKDLGQSCTCEYAFPAAMYIIIKHHNSFLDALKINNLCGGDSASRGMLIGAVLGALVGYHQIPENLIEQLNARTTVESFCEHKRL